MSGGIKAKRQSTPSKAAALIANLVCVNMATTPTSPIVTVPLSHETTSNMVTKTAICTICQHVQVNSSKLNCGHSFCRECITSWLADYDCDQRCPECRAVTTYMTGSDGIKQPAPRPTANRFGYTPAHPYIRYNIHT